MIELILIWNIFVFLVYGYDKRQAIKNKWRISEKFLVLCALCTGGIGAFSGMYIFRHKTKHLKFRIINFVSLFITIIFICYFISK